MMNLRQLQHFIDSTGKFVDSSANMNYKLMTPYIKYFSLPARPKNPKIVAVKDTVKVKAINEQIGALNNASSEVHQVQDFLKSRSENYKESTKSIRRYSIEYQKKFTLGAACIVLFLIGAPLGAIIRKGGLGLPVVISVAFFLIYYIISTISEKSAKDGSLSPFAGAWVSIIMLFPVGIFLSYKAATDSALFDVELYKRFFRKLIPRKAA
jgi:lipopolysaccharide export system permease protein